MNSYRKTGIIVGLLFLIALLFNLVGMAIYEPFTKSTKVLETAHPNRIAVIIGLLIDFISIPALVLIPIVAYPLFKHFDARLALGYVGFRALEGVLFTIGIINSFSLLSLSEQFLLGGRENAAFYHAIGRSIQAENEWSTLIYIIVFTLGAMMFYTLLYKSRLLPRFLSIWGLIAAAFMLVGAIIGLLGIVPLSTIMAVCGAPVGLNEFTIIVWLLIKGFNATALEKKS